MHKKIGKFEISPSTVTPGNQSEVAPLTPEKPREITFVKEKFMSPEGSQNMSVKPGVEMRAFGKQGQLTSCKSGGTYKPLKNKMSLFEF